MSDYELPACKGGMCQYGVDMRDVPNRKRDWECKHICILHRQNKIDYMEKEIQELKAENERLYKERKLLKNLVCQVCKRSFDGCIDTCILLSD